MLELISLKTGLNIVASKKVMGNVTANLVGVDLQTALAAILKSTGFAAAREGNIIYVGEPIDLQLMNLAQDHINTRVFRPNHAKAADLQVLFTPLLSTDGKVTVTTASQIDIPADQTKTGGNGFAGIDTVVVRDYETILMQLDEIFAEVDMKPRQVSAGSDDSQREAKRHKQIWRQFQCFATRQTAELSAALQPAASAASMSPTVVCISVFWTPAWGCFSTAWKKSATRT